MTSTVQDHNHASLLAEETGMEVSGMSAKNTRHLCRTIKMPGVNMAGLCDFLRQQHSQSTAYHVQARTGISSGTVENWLHGKATPSLGHFGVLMSVYGPELLRATFPNAPAWLDEARRACEREQLRAELQQLDERLRRLDGV